MCALVCKRVVGLTGVEQEKGMTVVVVVLCCVVLFLSGCFELCVAVCVILFLLFVVVDL